MTDKKTNDIELQERKADNQDTLQDKNILLVQSKPNEPHLTSKYQKSTNECLICIEYIRWKLNLLLLFRPFAFLCYIPTEYHLHQCLYRLTISEILFYILLFRIAYHQLLWFSKTFANSPVLMVGSSAVIASGSDAGSGSSDSGEESGLEFNLFETESVSGQSAEIWFVIAWISALRNTFIWNALFGFTFERMIVIHRLIARFAILIAIFHFWEYRNYNWFAGKCYTGTMALIPALVIFITSFSIFRRNVFTIFLKLHWICFALIAYYGFMHGATWLLLPVILTVMDMMYRWYTTFAKPVMVHELRVLHGNVVRIVFDKSDFQYEAGQYVFVCIPAIDFTQYHPFSLSSSPHHPHNVSIHIRVLGDWTAKLKRLAAYYQAQNRSDWQNLTCFVEGPYGCCQIPLHQYESIVMVSGGIGITPLQSIFNELVHNISSNSSGRMDDFLFSESKIKRIHFVWSVRDPSIIGEFNKRHWSGIKFKDITYYNDSNDSRLPQYFSPDLLIVKQETQIVQRTEIITHFYLTRVVDAEIQKEYQDTYPCLHFGRPNIEDILKEAKMEYDDDTKSNKSCVNSFITKGSGIGVLSCGPQSMLKDVKKYATKYGIDCHVEVFEF